jgi:hypothetical protein
VTAFLFYGVTGGAGNDLPVQALMNSVFPPGDAVIKSLRGWPAGIALKQRQERPGVTHEPDCIRDKITGGEKL